MSKKNKITKLQRLLDIDTLINSVNPYYNTNYSNEDYVIKFFCAKKLGFTKQCPGSCVQDWNSEWEGDKGGDNEEYSKLNNSEKKG
jgi:anionic cell wall polymer biosynthesis LytR-Cps2A-Psr (LCP) family protein